MEFRTLARPLERLQGTVSHAAPVLLVGSCFSDNIGTELRADLFDAVVNPFGPLYNPLSVESAFGIIATNDGRYDARLFCHEGVWHDWNFHSRFSSASAPEAARAMGRSVAAAREALASASAVIITLGTTTAYRLCEDDSVVANCHKMPARMFRQTDLSLAETTESLDRTIEIVRTVNPGAKIIFTVSPLRYLADGMHANTLIKSRLHLAIDAVSRSHEGIIYFPAY